MLSVASSFAVIAEPNRRAILGLLATSERSVGDIEHQLRMPQPSVSKHLRVLRQAGFGASRVDAQQRLHRITPTPHVSETRVVRAEAPQRLEYSWGGGDIRWQLQPIDLDGRGGTRLTLWHNINRGFISMGAAGWHICFDVLDRLLAGQPIGRIVGPEAMKFDGWQRLNAEYAKKFGVETPGWPPNAPKR